MPQAAIEKRLASGRFRVKGNADLATARSGTALGVMDTYFAIAGFAAPAVTGWLVEATGNFNAAFWLMAALSLSSVLVVLLFHQPDRAPRLCD